MPYPSPTERADLLEAISRNSHARRIVTGFCRATPTLANLWQQIGHSLSDVPILAAETTYLDGQLRAMRLDRANLAVVGRATLAASRDGDPGPLAFLRAELTVQGFPEQRQGPGPERCMTSYRRMRRQARRVHSGGVQLARLLLTVTDRVQTVNRSLPASRT